MNIYKYNALHVK